jgi:hypothetical protein
MISPSTPNAASWRKKSLQAAVSARQFETFQFCKPRKITLTPLRLSMAKLKWLGKISLRNRRDA